MRWCIRPGCENVVELKDQSNPFLVCGACGQEFCHKCNSEAHPNQSCEEFIDKLYKNYIRAAEVRHCPQCHALIEKNEGCNHMTCIQCNYQFCWLCERKYTADHYSLFNLNGCPGLQFTNISKNASPWRRRCHWLKSLLLSILITILVITVGPLVLVVMAIGFPLSRWFFDQRIKCGNCKEASISFAKFLGLLLLGILTFPFTMVVFLIVFILRVTRGS